MKIATRTKKLVGSFFTTLLVFVIGIILIVIGGSWALIHLLGILGLVLLLVGASLIFLGFLLLNEFKSLLQKKNPHY